MTNKELIKIAISVIKHVKLIINSYETRQV